MKYIKRFDTEDGYNSYYSSNSFVLPNLSLIDELIEVGNEMRFNPDLDGPMEPDPKPEEPPYDPSNGYEYVDLGLPSGLKWAKCNIGASTAIDNGLYFAWGETVGYKDTSSGKRFDWSDYKYCNGSYNTLTKYNTNSSYGTVDNKTTLEPSDDAATVNMGSSWRMPSSGDYQELIDNTTNTWTTVNGVNGRLFTGNNGNTLFLPASGYCDWGSVGYVGSYGYYWSSSLDEGGPGSAWYLSFSSGYVYVSYDTRYSGRTVRGVVG